MKVNNNWKINYGTGENEIATESEVYDFSILKGDTSPVENKYCTLERASIWGVGSTEDILDNQLIKYNTLSNEIDLTKEDYITIAWGFLTFETTIVEATKKTAKLYLGDCLGGFGGLQYPYYGFGLSSLESVSVGPNRFQTMVELFGSYIQIYYQSGTQYTALTDSLNQSIYQVYINSRVGLTDFGGFQPISNYQDIYMNVCNAIFNRYYVEYSAVSSMYYIAYPIVKYVTPTGYEFEVWFDPDISYFSIANYAFFKGKSSTDRIYCRTFPLGSVPLPDNHIADQVWINKNVVIEGETSWINYSSVDFTLGDFSYSANKSNESTANGIYIVSNHILWNHGYNMTAIISGFNSTQMANLKSAVNVSTDISGKLKFVIKGTNHTIEQFSHSYIGQLTRATLDGPVPL